MVSRGTGPVWHPKISSGSIDACCNNNSSSSRPRVHDGSSLRFRTEASSSESEYSLATSGSVSSAGTASSVRAADAGIGACWNTFWVLIALERFVVDVVVVGGARDDAVAVDPDHTRCEVAADEGGRSAALDARTALVVALMTRTPDCVVSLLFSASSVDARVWPS